MQSCSRMLLAAALVLIAVSFVTTGCGSSSNGAKLRFVNATPDESSMDLLVDSKDVAAGVGYGAASTYVSVSTGSRHSQVEPTGTSIILIDRTDSVGSGNNLTLISLNYSFNISSTLLTDDNSAPASGNFKLRIVNASPGMGAQDVYVVPPGTDITSVSPTISGLAFGSASSYSSLAAGNFDVFFTAPGTKFVSLESGQISFNAGQIRTMLALNSPSGGYMSTLLTDLN